MTHVAIFLTLSALIPGGLLASQPGADNIGSATPAILLLTYSGARLASIAATGVSRVTQITFWVFIYVFLALTPTLQIAYSRWSWPYRYDSGSVLEAYLLIYVGIAAYELGTRLWTTPVRGSSDWLTVLLARRIRLTWVMATAITVLAAIPFLVIELGGAALLFASRNERFDLLVEATAGDNKARLLGLSTLLAVVPIVCATVLFQYALRLSSIGRGLRWPHVLLLVFVSLLCVIVNNPISSARYIVGTMVLWTLFAYLLERRSIANWLGVFLSVALVFLFPVADAFRASLDPSDTFYYGPSVVDRITTKADFDAFQQILNALAYVSEKGIGWGNQLLGTLGFWVPRNYWPDKPESTGSILADYRAYEYTNLSLPLWGELYFDGSYALVVAGFLGYGWLTARIESYVKQQQPSRPYLTLGEVLLVAYAAYQIFILRGALLPSFAYFAPIALLLFVWSSPARINRVPVHDHSWLQREPKATP